VSSDTTQGTQSSLVAPPSPTFPYNHLFSFPIFLSDYPLSPCLFSSCMCHLRMLRRQNWDTDTTTQSIDRVSPRVACGWSLRSLSFSSFPASFAAFLFSSSSATNRCSSFSSFTSWARVCEGVEEVRPYGPGLPGFVRWFTYTGCPILKNVSARTDIFSDV